MKFPFSFWGVPSGRVIATRSLTVGNQFASIKVATASTVDWGDGQPLMPVAANTQVNYTYTGTLGDVTVIITADAPLAMNPDLSVKHPASTAVDAGWTEVIIRDPHFTDFTVKPNAGLRTLRILGDNKWRPTSPGNCNFMPDIEEIEIDFHMDGSELKNVCSDNTKLKRFVSLRKAENHTAYAFRNCKFLEFVHWDLSIAISTSYMFIGANLAFNPVFHLPEVTNMDAMFQATTGITSLVVTGTGKAGRANSFIQGASVATINRMDLSALTSGDSMFRTPHLVNHPGYIGELTQNASYMFFGCSLLEAIGDIGMANVTNTNNILTGCSKLRSFTLRGLRVSIAINGLNLDATALDAVFTSLGTANAGATINITGNPGAATCNKAIATAKSWGVTG